MGSNLYVDSEWQQLIDSFPEGSSTLEIVAACINKFGDAGKGLTFSDWGQIVRQYLVRGALVKSEPIHTILKDECCSVNPSHQWCIIEKEPVTCVHDCVAEYQVGSLENIQLDHEVAKYAEMFANLSVYCRLGRKAPHKAIMLLSVIDLISTQQICTNQIEFSKLLEDCFARNWKRHVGVSSLFHPKAGTPFWHMNSEPFWRLVPIEEDKERLTVLQMGNPTSARTIRKYIRYAEIDKSLFELLQNEINREELCDVLIKHYL